MADLKEAGGVVDINLLEQGLIAVWYDNSGYICEAYWVRGNTYFTQCEHEEVLPLVDMSENLSGFMIQGVEWISQDVEGFVAINLKSNLSKSSTGQDSRGQTAAAIAERDYLNPIEQGVIDVRFDRYEHYCEVRWGKGSTIFVDTDKRIHSCSGGCERYSLRVQNHKHRSASRNPMGCVGTTLKTKVKITAT